MKFTVAGAGQIEISETPEHLCGGKVGFSIKASWGVPGGGVIGRSDALRMARHVIEQCEGITESEEEQYSRLMHNLLK